MERTEYVKKKRKVLKIVAITLGVILSLLIIIGLIYARFGIAGLFQNSITSNLLGLNKQVNLGIPTVSGDEKAAVNKMLGYDLETADKASLTSNKKLDLILTPQEATYLLTSLSKNDDTFQNLQITATTDGEVALSTVANVALACQMVGENVESIESSIGDLPDTVPVYIELAPDHEDGNSSVSKIKVGQMTVPGGIYTSINGFVDQGLDLLFENALGVDLENISVKDGQIEISGEFPAP